MDEESQWEYTRWINLIIHDVLGSSSLIHGQNEFTIHTWGMAISSYRPDHDKKNNWLTNGLDLSINMDNAQNDGYRSFKESNRSERGIHY